MNHRKGFFSNHRVMEEVSQIIKERRNLEVQEGAEDWTRVLRWRTVGLVRSTFGGAG